MLNNAAGSFECFSAGFLQAPNAKTNFTNLLAKAVTSQGKQVINNPDQKILHLLVKHFPTRLLAVGIPSDALELYEHAKVFPSTTSEMRISSQFESHLIGPINE